MLGQRLAGTAAIALVWLSCTFPDISIDGPPASTSSSGGSQAQASQASGSTTTAGGGNEPCLDKDGDTHTDHLCGGTDCNDGDDRAFPGQPEFFDGTMNPPAAAGGWYDFDCDGMPEMRPDQVLPAPCKLAQCGQEGWQSTDDCGSNDGYVKCVLLNMGLECSDTMPIPGERLHCH